MSALPDPRIVSLEIAVAHQGKTIEDLSATHEHYRLGVGLRFAPLHK